MKARFNKVKSRYTNKFTFDNNTTLGIGNVQPLFCKQIAGGSKVSVNFGQLTRLSPLVVPSFARLKQRNDFVFVPMSMVMPSFDAFLSHTMVSGTSRGYIPDSVPCITNQALFLSLVSHSAYCQGALAHDDSYVRGPINFHLSFYSGDINVSNAFSNSGIALPTLKELPHSYFDFVLHKGDLIYIGDDTSFSVCLKLTQAGRFWYTVLRGLGYTLDYNDITPVSILPLWAFVKAYYDIYYPKRENPWHASNYYKQINSFYNGDHIDALIGGLDYDLVNSFDVLQPLFGSDTYSFDFFVTTDDSLVTAATISPINQNSSAGNPFKFDSANHSVDGQWVFMSTML